jgi:hypothetical protein
MNVATELVTSAGGLLAILLALGAGPAALLPQSFDAATRIALAPVLGFCLGTCLTTTVLEFAPAGDSYPLLIVLAVASVAFAAWRARRARWQRPTLRDAAQLLVVCVAVAVPLGLVLHDRHSVGPASYYFTDVDNYVAVQEAADTTSLREARADWAQSIRTGADFGDLGRFVYAFIADFGSNLDATPLHANVNAVLGRGAIDTFAPFLVVLLLIGGLGAFAVVRRIAAEPTWTAVLAGSLFGGPLFLVQWFDTYQASIVALALLMPAVLLGAEALRDRRLQNLALLALVLATFITVYPLWVPPLVLVGAGALAWHAAAERRAGTSARALARTLLVPALAVAAMTFAFDPVAVIRTVGYYSTVLGGSLQFPRVAYRLPLEVLPGWLLQTREFWFLTPLGAGGFKPVLFGALIPLVFVAFVALAIARLRIALALLALGAAFGAAAFYAYSSADACTYCGQRYLLGLAPILVVLLTLGLWLALRSPSRLWRVAGIAGAVLVVAAVGQRARVSLDRFAGASFFMDVANRVALKDLPQDDRPLHLEGYWASVRAQAEQPLAYHLANHRAPGRVSISLGTDVGNALQYLTFSEVRPPGPEFRADYRYLLTRFSGVATDRRLVVRRGAIGLMERTRPLDVTPYAGLTIEQARIDGSGVPSVLPGGTLGLHVVGPGSGPVWARLRFETAEAVAVPRRRGLRARQRGGTLTLCARASGTAPVRNVAFVLPVSAPGLVRLMEMRAVTRRCVP